MSSRIVGTERIYSGWSTLDIVTVEQTGGGTTTRLKREVHDHGNGVAVLAYDAEARTALLVRQFRVPPALQGDTEPLLEVIAGILDVAGEDAEGCARREALEEAGVRLGGLELVGRAYASPGAVSERLHLFLAVIDTDAARELGGGAEGEHEGIEVVETPLAELARLADAGLLADLKTFLLVQTLRLRRPELFGGSPSEGRDFQALAS